jgi:hypothetical protein
MGTQKNRDIFIKRSLILSMGKQHRGYIPRAQSSSLNNILWRIYACKNCNIVIRSRYCAIVDEAVYSLCCAEDSRPEPTRAEA